MLKLLNPWRGLGGLPRAMWILAAALLVNRAGSMVLAFLALYVARERGFGEDRAAIVMSLWGGTSLVAALVGGRLADRWGAVPLIKVATVASGLALLAFPLARSWPALLGVTALAAFVTDCVRPAILAAIADLVPADRRRAAYALERLAINLGMSIGPALGGVLAQVDYTWLFIADGGTSLAAGLLVVAGLRAPSRAARLPAARSLGLGALGDLRLVRFLGLGLLVMLVFFQDLSSMSVYVVEHLGLGERAYGLTFTLNTILIVLVEVQLTAASSTWPWRRSLALGALAIALGFGAIGLVHGLPGLLATAVLWTFGEMLILPTMSAWVAEIAPAGRTGDYMGAYSMMFSVAFLVGPGAGVALLGRIGPHLWTVCLGVGLVATLAYLTVPGRPSSVLHTSDNGQRQ